MVKIRYMNCYPRVKVREVEIRNAILSEDTYGLAIHYDRNSENPGLYYSSLGTYRNKDGIVVLIATLVINGTEYNAETIRRHFAEVKTLLDQEHMEKLLKEIDD